MIDIEESKLFYETNYDLMANYNCSAHNKVFVDAEKMKPYIVLGGFLSYG